MRRPATRFAAKASPCSITLMRRFVHMSHRMDLSIVVPLFNEARTVEEFYRRLSSVLITMDRTYEILFVDDGSTDDTFFGLSAIASRDAAVRLIKLTRNYGQTAALAAGFDR